MFRFVARPCRRVLLLLLWLCMAYGVFHFAVKDYGSETSSPSAERLAAFGGRLGVAPLTVASIYSNNLDLGDNNLDPQQQQLPAKVIFQVSSSSSVGKVSTGLPDAGAAGGVVNSSGSVELLGASSWPMKSNNAGNLALTVGTSSTVTPRYPWLDDEPLVDKETKTVEQLILEAAATIRNIPHPPYILGQKDGPKFYKNASCARFPTIYDIEFSNTYWQVIKNQFYQSKY